MISKKAGGLLYEARIKLKLTSLDGIAKLTGLDKRTIRRYETGELAIPKIRRTFWLKNTLQMNGQGESSGEMQE